MFMEGKVFSIPFRMRSDAGAYTCRDGEVESSSNAILSSVGTDASETGPDLSPVSPPGERDFTQEFPTAPLMEFALKRSVLPGWHNHPDRFPATVMECSDASPAAWGRKAIDMLSAIGEAAAQKNLFIQPFLAICALRLADGSRILPSPPVLMVPNSEPPLVAGDTDLARDSMEMKAVTAICTLQYRLTVPDSLSEWQDRVEGIEVMVSAPIPLHNPAATPLSLHNASTTAFSHSFAPSGLSTEHRLTSDVFSQGWKPEAICDADFYKALTETHVFYVVSSIPLKSAVTSADFKDVDFNLGVLSNFGSFETYTPDYAHRSGIHAAWCTVFSGRTTLCDLTLTLPEALPYAAIAPYTSGAADGGASPSAVEVTVRKGGKTHKSMSCGNSSPAVEIGDGALPRWLFFPDPDATEIKVTTVRGTWSFPLRRHPAMHGAFFWCGGFHKTTSTEMGITQTGTRLGDNVPDLLVRDSYRLPAAAWRSEKGKNLLFPDRLLTNLDVDRVIAVCRAFRSSGLVATTSPTAYLFTTSGIFLLKEMEDGSLRDAGLIGTHILRDASSFSIGGSFVEFVTESGESFRIEGTVIKAVAAGTSSATGSSSSVLVIHGDGSGKPVEIETRPIKLGDPEAFKRIASVALRGDFSGKATSMEIYGSRDLHTWHLLARISRNHVSGIWASPVRFLKVAATLPLSTDETLETLAVKTLPTPQ